MFPIYLSVCEHLCVSEVCARPVWCLQCQTWTPAAAWASLAVKPDLNDEAWVSSQVNSCTFGWKCLPWAVGCDASVPGQVFQAINGTPALPADDGVGRTGCSTLRLSPRPAKLFSSGLLMELIYLPFTATQWAPDTRFLLLITNMANWC